MITKSYRGLCVFVVLVVGFAARPIFAAGTWSAVATPSQHRQQQTLTVLQSGKILMVGGVALPGGAPLASTEIYDPAANTWTAGPNLAAVRSSHTATLLPNGKVLVVAGYTGSVLNTAELYDPASNTWSSAGTISVGRYAHSATLLNNGTVLVAGGWNGSSSITNVDIYDPATNTWSAGASLSTFRHDHAAALLPNGKVIVVAGTDNSGPIGTAEIYDPVGNAWSAAASLSTARSTPSVVLLPNGKVLAACGSYLNVAEIYDTVGNSWSSAGNLASGRGAQSASLLPNGKVLVVCGGNGSNTLGSAELYDPAGNSWSLAPAPISPRQDHAATILPSGAVLVVGGASNSGGNPSVPEIFSYDSGSWSGAANIATARAGHTATLLPNGKVLVAGGNGNAGYLNSVELYDPTGNSWNSTASLASGHDGHSATLLQSGKVLVAGGNTGSGVTNTAEIYDSGSGTWSASGSLGTGRVWHTATLLPSGKVLVAGGFTGSGGLTSAELYDPSANTFSAAGNMATMRYAHTATLLPNGKVLVAGGQVNGGSSYTNTAEIYDPAANSWSSAASMSAMRGYQIAALLQNGKVLVASGADAGGGLTSAELYDPSANTWSAAGNLTTGRAYFDGRLLPSGKVLIAGGQGAGYYNSAEIYDPTSNSWTVIASLATARTYPTLTLLPSGKVLAASGYSGNWATSGTCELFDPGLGFASPSQPVLSTVTSPLALGSKFSATGTVFKGISEASTGSSQSSATNYPLVQLRSLANDQVAFLPADSASNWSDTAFDSAPVAAFPTGYAMVTVFTNGIPSASKIISVTNNSSSITSPGSASGVYATAFTYTIQANNTPTSYDAVNLPAGLSVNHSNGVISGNPGAVGSFNVTISATNGGGAVSATLTLTIVKATPTINWSNPAGITYPATLSGTQLNASVVGNLPGSFSYTPASGTVLNAGNQSLSVTFTPTDTTNYNTVNDTVSINVGKGTPTVSWATPGDISFGTALSATQLNASADTVGSFAYTPASGTVLNAGNNQSLSVQFTPNDTANWNTPAAVSVSINVVASIVSLSVDPNPVEPGKTVTFTLGGSDGQTITWDFGDGSPNISGSQVTHVYSTVGTFTVTVTLATATSSSKQTINVEVSNANSRVIGDFTIAPNPASPGDQITFTATANANAGGQVNFTFSFGDGADSGQVTDPSNTVTAKHTYAAVGDYPVVLTARDGNGKLIGTASQTAFIVPQGTAHDGTGTKLTNKLDGVAIQIDDKVGGIVALDVQVLAPNRDAFEVGTDFGVTGRSTAVKGTRPVHKYEKSGLYVATSRAFDIDTGSEQGKMRKTIAISGEDAGEDALVKAQPGDHGVKVSGIKGKFSFAALVKDAVAFGGTVELPEGFDVRREHQLSIAIGNVVDNVTVTNRGQPASQGENFSILKLALKMPKLAKGTYKTSAGQKASLSVTLSAADLSAQGFDTEGIKPALAADETAGATVSRNIQIAIMIDGVTYETLQQVQYKVAKNTGQISGRSGK